jgi:hypothetical protein
VLEKPNRRSFTFTFLFTRTPARTRTHRHVYAAPWPLGKVAYALSTMGGALLTMGGGSVCVPLTMLLSRCFLCTIATMVWAAAPVKEEAELFYTPASPELIALRGFIAEYSFPR